MRSVLASLTILALAGPALAEEPPPPPEAPKAAGPAGERVVLPAKRLYVQAAFEINLSSGSAGKPLSLAPDVFYGVNDALTVGLVHSSRGGSGFIGGVGSSLCFTGCDFYNGFGLDGRYQFASGKVSAAANVGLYAAEVDPFSLALKLGVIGRFRPTPESKLAVDFAPALSIGITEREPPIVMGMAVGAGNKEVFALPVSVVYAVKPQIAVMAQTGLILPFAAAGDAFAVPFSVGGSYAVNKQISVDAAFSFPALLGGGELTGVDARSFTIGGGYAF
jgi:hypothetical protein